MRNNYAKQGAVLYLNDISISAESENSIRSCKFENNVSEKRGAIFLSFDAGIMEISNNTFESNRGVESCIVISSNADPDTNYTKIQNNVFNDNDGTSISVVDNLFRSQIQLEENNFSQNSSQAVVILRHAIVTDKKSTYRYNNAESGASVTIMRDTEYRGDGIIFDNNKANTRGGAVLATT